MEKWILSRLHQAVTEADKGWREFDLSRSTTAIYNFWLYELCDVYLVHIFLHLAASDLEHQLAGDILTPITGGH